MYGAREPDQELAPVISTYEQCSLCASAHSAENHADLTSPILQVPRGAVASSECGWRATIRRDGVSRAWHVLT